MNKDTGAFTPTIRIEVSDISVLLEEEEVKSWKQVKTMKVSAGSSPAQLLTDTRNDAPTIAALAPEQGVTIMGEKGEWYIAVIPQKTISGQPSGYFKGRNYVLGFVRKSAVKDP